MYDEFTSQGRLFQTDSAAPVEKNKTSLKEHMHTLGEKKTKNEQKYQKKNTAGTLGCKLSGVKLICILSRTQLAHWVVNFQE